MMTALEALLAGLVDYAGLFPPAALDMPSAVRAYAEFRRGPRAGALGAFVLPASRLQPFAEACAALGLAEDDAWPVTVIAGDAPERDVAAALALQAASLPGLQLRVRAIEARASTAVEVERLATVVPGSVGLALEVPLSVARERQQPVLAAIKTHGRMAKVRTGGVIVDAIPSTLAIAEFIWDCARTGVPFKATAGLHHPVRSLQRLTDDASSPWAVMHGFVNLFAAAVLAWRAAGASAPAAPPADVLGVLEEQDASAFQWSPASLTWRGTVVSAGELVHARRAFARGFGSCSLNEPISDLEALGWLPPSPVAGGTPMDVTS